jgi:hypothetical protein
MKSLYPKCMLFTMRYFKTKTFLLVFIFSFSFFSSFSQGHVFQNASLESGKAGADKAVYPFPPATTAMVTGTRLNVDEVTFSLGGENFTPASSSAMTFLPSTLIDWKAEVVKNNVQLNWSTTIEKNATHYIVERSTDGKVYTEAGNVAAGVNSENRKHYSFTDFINVNEGLVYYRLKSTDLDGRTRVSDVRTVRITKAVQSLAVNTYPNPVVTDLNITLPGNWCGKKLSVDIYNVNGVLVKHMVRETASKTETIDVNQLKPGIYVVKANAGEETAVKQIIK